MHIHKIFLLTILKLGFAFRSKLLLYTRYFPAIPFNMRISSSSKGNIEEVLVPFNLARDNNKLTALQFLRPKLKIAQSVIMPNGNSPEASMLLWAAYRSGIQIDSVELEDMYLGKRILTDLESVTKWNEIISDRLELLNTVCNKDSYISKNKFLGDGGDFQYELDTAIAVVQRSAYVSRSLQKILLDDKSDKTSKVDKSDNSPVTIADFAVQAVIISILSKNFPSDKFIAEEDSEILRLDDSVCEGVLDAVYGALGERWSKETLFEVIDKGSYDGSDMKNERVWILDPVDGTKGFMRNQHFCIALGFVQGGIAKLSVLGCPNLNIHRVLQGVGYDNRNVGFIDAAIPVQLISDPALTSELTFFSENEDSTIEVAHPRSGSVYFAVSGRGSHARAVSMPLGSAFEVSVSGEPAACNAALCESFEASHGNREVTTQVFNTLQLHKEYVRLDGQCKYCIIGAGAAEGNMRLPAAGYKEKTWDQAPGVHFILEAGGNVTDLNGQQLDFNQGRYLNVTGIIASNGKFHGDILHAVRVAKNEEAIIVK